MVIDHALHVAGFPWWSRVGPTRASLPLFMLVSGWLLAGRTRPANVRCAQLAIAAAVGGPLSWFLGLGAPDILAVYIVALFLWWCARAHPVAAITVGFVGAYTLPFGWAGYEPGYVLGLIGVGALMRSTGRDYWSWGDRLPSFFEWAGRRPLSLFVGHLAVLAWLVAVLP